MIEAATFKTFQMSQDYQTNERCIKIEVDLDVALQGTNGKPQPMMAHRLVVNN